MKVSYEFADGTTSEVEVSEELGTMIIGSRTAEESADRKERRHCWSLDAILYEGTEYGTQDDNPAEKLRQEELHERISRAFSHLTAIQQRRILMLAGGLSEREIARREGKDFKTVHESIESARKKFKKFF